ncbi:MAG: hypothetical protein WD025_02865 [Bacteriovoracaceae bacterium]
MDGIKQQAYQQKQEAIQTRHSFQLRKENREMRAELDKLKEQNEAAVTRLKKDYDKKALQEQTKLETQLNEIRQKNKQLLSNERKRYERMREETLLTHKQQLEELKISQEKEIASQTNKHQDYMESAQQRFEAEKIKYES